MAKDRLTLQDKYGNERPYDVSSEDVTLDNEAGKSLKNKLVEIDDAVDERIKSVTFNGTTPLMDKNGNVNLGQQTQADWGQVLEGYPSYIRNKPTIPSRTSQLTNDSGYITIEQVPAGSTVDTQMSSTSENAVQNKVIKAYVDAVSQRIDTLIGSGNVQGAIDTFNEVVAFLNGINSSDTLAAKLLLKADKSTTYTKTETDAAIAEAVEGLGGGSVESVTINGTNHTPTNGVVDLGTIHDGVDGITPHIGQDGYWYIGTTNTGFRAEGLQGNSGVGNADNFVSVNNLDGGTTDTAQQVFVLGANMGKELNDKISPLSPLVETITGEDEIEYTENHGYRSYGSSIGGTYTEVNQNSDGYVGRKLSVSAGDTLTVYGKTNVWCALYLLTDLNGEILAIGPSNTEVSENDAVTIQVQSDGYAYLSAYGSVAHGCTRSYSRTGYKVATESNDGIMSKEQVAMLDAAGGPDIEVLKGYVTDKTETITGVFVTGEDLRNYQVQVGDTYTGTTTQDNARSSCMLPVKAGDVVTLWCVTNAWNHGYVICDAEDTVVFVSGNNFSATESSPAVVNIQQDGKIYIACNTGESCGAVLQRESRVFRNATAEQDGLMPKEIAALFDGDSLNDDAASLKLKKFAFIGDSFSAPNQWQAKMCEVLGAFDSINKAVSGGAWWGNDNLSAYYQAQGLVSSGITPDYILCTLGTNDISQHPLGTLDNLSIVSQTIGTAEGNINPANSTTEGVQATLITLKRAFPNAIIKIGYTPAGYLHDDVSEYAAADALCERLKDLANIYGVGYIETRRCGISRVVLEERLLYEGNTNGASFTGHPSAAGQQRIGEYMARLMLNNL